MRLLTSVAFAATSLLLPVLTGAETIADVQGHSHFSPYHNKVVKGVRGIVTAKSNSNFYIQDPKGDGDDRTSEGLYIFVPTSNKEWSSFAANLSIASEVIVDGTVVEYSDKGSPNDLSLTEISFVTNITVVGTNVPVEPLQIGPDSRAPPTTYIFHPQHDGPLADRIPPTSASYFESNYTSLDVGNKGLDFYESLEGMLVTIKNPVVTGQPFSGQLYVLPDGGKGATSRNAAGSVTMTQSADGVTDNNPERIFIGTPLGGGSHPKNVAMGDVVSDITGVITYNKGAYKVLPLGPVKITKQNTNVFPKASATPASQFAIGSYNMENLGGNAAAAKFAAIGAQIVDYLGSPAIFVANEIQDDDGPSDTGAVSCAKTVQKVSEAIVSAGGPKYEAAWVDPVNNQDGGQPGGNIRSVIFYNPAAGVKLVEGKPGAPTEATQVVKDAAGLPTLSLNPGRISPADPAWSDSRKGLAAAFDVEGVGRVFVIGNHLSSKGGSTSAYGAVQPPISGAADRRLAQSKLNREFALELIKADPKAKIAIVGDLNDFSWSTALRTLLGNVPGEEAPAEQRLYDLSDEFLPAEERYSYNYDGQCQELDHIVTSPALLEKLAEFVPVHVNTWGEFSKRTSDHDPMYARFHRGDTPVVTSSTGVPEPTATATATATAGPSTEPCETDIVIPTITGEHPTDFPTDIPATSTATGIPSESTSAPVPGETEPCETEIVIPTITGEHPTDFPTDVPATSTATGIPSESTSAPVPGETEPCETEIVIPTITGEHPTDFPTDVPATSTATGIPSESTSAPVPGETEPCETEIVIPTITGEHPTDFPTDGPVVSTTVATSEQPIPTGSTVSSPVPGETEPCETETDIVVPPVATTTVALPTGPAYQVPTPSSEPSTTAGPNEPEEPCETETDIVVPTATDDTPDGPVPTSPSTPVYPVPGTPGETPINQEPPSYTAPGNGDVPIETPVYNVPGGSSDHTTSSSAPYQTYPADDDIFSGVSRILPGVTAAVAAVAAAMFGL
ncbi:hypothetical protein HDU85_006451 [Gaertneriomyces sp. JEL0708]|nr:hypothetical protein HDU85_006451 [Gaertneriomyces sp. JEL0708]